MHAKVGCGGNTSDESEKSAQSVEDQKEDWVNGEALLDRDKGKVEEGEHAENSDEHVIVDDRRSASDRKHVSNECHTEEDPEELQR